MTLRPQRNPDHRSSLPTTAPIVLASASPRRQALLHRLGLPFVVRPSGIDETSTIGEPELLVRHLARAKAAAVTLTGKEHVVVGSDTIVVIDGRVLGKPIDAADAATMLARLAGRRHTVFTGVAVLDCLARHTLTTAVRSTVELRPLTTAEIAAYVATGEPLDKAGSYAAQGRGADLIARIDGCLTNVIGLPLCALAPLLRAVGVPAGPVRCQNADGQPADCHTLDL